MGNTVFETWKGNWPLDKFLCIRLKFSFQERHGPLATGLRFHSVNDPHSWKLETKKGRDSRTQGDKNNRNVE